MHLKYVTHITVNNSFKTISSVEINRLLVFFSFLHVFAACMLVPDFSNFTASGSV